MGTPLSLSESLVVEHASFPALVLGQLAHFAEPRNCPLTAYQFGASKLGYLGLYISGVYEVMKVRTQLKMLSVGRMLGRHFYYDRTL